MTSVAEAAEILDRLYPHWYSKVNVETLNLRACALCILGQTTGSYLGAWKNMVASGWSGDSKVFEYNQFIPDWIREIEWRRKQDVVLESVTVAQAAPPKAAILGSIGTTKPLGALPKVR